MPITLGKDATLTVGGAIASIRNVTFTSSARTIDVEAYGERYVQVYSTGWDASVSFEALDSSEITLSTLTDGTAVTISGGNAGWSFTGIVTSISETNSIDGVTAYAVECRMTRAGLR